MSIEINSSHSVGGSDSFDDYYGAIDEYRYHIIESVELYITKHLMKEGGNCQFFVSVGTLTNSRTCLLRAGFGCSTKIGITDNYNVYHLNKKIPKGTTALRIRGTQAGGDSNVVMDYKITIKKIL